MSRQHAFQAGWNLGTSEGQQVLPGARFESNATIAAFTVEIFGVARDLQRLCVCVCVCVRARARCLYRCLNLFSRTLRNEGVGRSWSRYLDVISGCCTTLFASGQVCQVIGNSQFKGGIVLWGERYNS